MAHFAQLNETNVVIQVIVVNNDEILVNGVESEDKGIEFCKSIFGQDTRWAQTSYNGSFRKNFAGIGMRYDQILDGFIENKPYPSWSLNESTCKWEAPTPCPTDDNGYFWNEDFQQWQTIEEIVAYVSLQGS